jgi:hypothetical protein
MLERVRLQRKREGRVVGSDCDGLGNSDDGT